MPPVGRQPALCPFQQTQLPAIRPHDVPQGFQAADPVGIGRSLQHGTQFVSQRLVCGAVVQHQQLLPIFLGFPHRQELAGFLCVQAVVVPDKSGKNPFNPPLHGGQHLVIGV